MMPVSPEPRRCPECGATWLGKQTCEPYFHQMLFWEAEQPAYGAEVRQRNRVRVDSSKRDWKITATATSHGSYDRDMAWPMTAVCLTSDRYQGKLLACGYIFELQDPEG